MTYPALPRRGTFITGTDTGVGKTYLGALLIRELCARGIRVSPRKPVESGCALRDGQPWPADAAALRAAGRDETPLTQVCPWRLRAPISPERAAAREGVLLDRRMLVEACSMPAEDFGVIEGAGGLYSPLARDALNVDLCTAVGLPLVIVAADRLGCLNHTLLSCAAARAHGLAVAAVVVNRLSPGADRDMGNREELAARLDLTVLELPYRARPDAPAIRALADLLTADR